MDPMQILLQEIDLNRENLQVMIDDKLDITCMKHVVNGMLEIDQVVFVNSNIELQRGQPWMCI